MLRGSKPSTPRMIVRQLTKIAEIGSFRSCLPAVGLTVRGQMRIGQGITPIGKDSGKVAHHGKALHLQDWIVLLLIFNNWPRIMHPARKDYTPKPLVLFGEVYRLAMPSLQPGRWQPTLALHGPNMNLSSKAQPTGEHHWLMTPIQAIITQDFFTWGISLGQLLVTPAIGFEMALSAS
ncbi:MAG: hypothetical protein IPM84_12995 [Anaerolineae bacterium]|nr:hypothetical protein [Anaerolineae bacterium]